MKNIDKIEQDLRDMLHHSNDQTLLEQAHHTDQVYIYEQLTADDTDEQSFDYDESSYDFFTENQKEPRANNTIYYTISEDTVVYEIGNNPQKISFHLSSLVDIQQQIWLHALNHGHIGIFKDIKAIRDTIFALKQARNEEKVKEQKMFLDQHIQHYNARLQLMFPDNPALYINSSLLPLPALFDPRAVQVANAIPEREGTYRRSQRSHPYHETDPDGVEVELQSLDTFLQSRPNRKDLYTLSVINNVVIYHDADADADAFKHLLVTRKPHEYVIYKKGGQLFIYGMGGPDQPYLGPVPQAHEEITFETAQQYISELKDTSLILKDYTGKIYRLNISEALKDSISTKIIQTRGLTNAEALAILDAIKEETGKEIYLKFELNHFGDRIVEVIGLKGEAYNLGANASRLDKVVQYMPNHVSHQASRKQITALKDRVLEHKKSTVDFMVQHLKTESFQCLNVYEDQLKAQYPCLIVTFKNLPIAMLDSSTQQPPIPEGYSEFVTHLMIAQINLQLEAAGLSPLIDRRQSFGFLTPTLTDVHTGVRLSFGLVPNDAWKECVIKGIKKTDDILKHLSFQATGDKLLDKFRGGSFAGNGYKYLQTFFKQSDPRPEEILDFLTGQNMEGAIPFVRTNEQNYSKTINNLFERDIIAKYYVFDEENNKIVCYEKGQIPRELIVESAKINYFILRHIGPEEKIKLTTMHESWLLDSIQMDTDVAMHAVDATYQELYNDIMLLYHTLLNSDYDSIAQRVNLEAATRELITAQFEVIDFLLDAAPLITDDTSDDTEGDENEQKNYYTPAGMAALFAPLIAAKQAEKDYPDDLPFPYNCTADTYFELRLSWNKSLANDLFIRSDLITRTIKGGIYTSLKKQFSDLMQHDTNAFFSQLVDFAYHEKLRNNAVTVDDLISKAEQLKRDLTMTDSTLPNEALAPICGIIIDSFPDYFSQENINRMSQPSVFYIDINPCVNDDSIPVKTAEEVLEELLRSGVFPKVLIVDITSATREQFNVFLTKFKDQTDIPILVTASSMVKHDELGLDLWQGGENKVYTSLAEEDEYLVSFKRELKALTQGTESGLGRHARRFIRDTSAKLHTEFKPTRGDGNCFFHAAFGADHGEYIEDLSCADHRAQLINRMKENIDLFLQNHTRVYLTQMIQDLWLNRLRDPADFEKSRLNEIYDQYHEPIDIMLAAYEEFIANDLSDHEIFQDFIKHMQEKNNAVYVSLFGQSDAEDARLRLNIILNESTEENRTTLANAYREEWLQFRTQIQALHQRNGTRDINAFFDTLDSNTLTALCRCSLDFFNHDAVYMDYHFSAFMPFIFDQEFPDGFVLTRSMQQNEEVTERYTQTDVVANNAVPHVYFNGTNHYMQIASHTLQMDSTMEDNIRKQKHIKQTYYLSKHKAQAKSHSVISDDQEGTIIIPPPAKFLQFTKMNVSDLA